MRKLLQIGFWWIPVLIAVTVGLLLYFINGMSFVAVWRDAALIAEPSSEQRCGAPACNPARETSDTASVTRHQRHTKRMDIARRV